jgi:hypothetical protein
MESFWQAEENNTTFIFWLLLRGIPDVLREKMRKSELQGLGPRAIFLLALAPNP